MALKIPAHMSQTCQAMRQYIMSMSQAGTEPAWPEARTCVSGHVTALYLCHEEEAHVQKVTNYLQVITMCLFFFFGDQIPVTTFPQHCSSPILLTPSLFVSLFNRGSKYVCSGIWAVWKWDLEGILWWMMMKPFHPPLSLGSQFHKMLLIFG